MKTTSKILVFFLLLAGSINARTLPGFPELAGAGFTEAQAGKGKNSFVLKERSNFVTYHGRSNFFKPASTMTSALHKQPFTRIGKPKTDLLSRIIRSNLKLSFRISGTFNLTISYL